MLKKYGFTLSFFGWMALVTVLSLVSFSDSDLPKVKIPGLDKAVHFTFYCVATILGCFFLRERTQGDRSMQSAALIFGMVTIVYGIIIEVLQHNMKGARDGNIYDALANISGTLVGIAVIFWLFSAKGPLRWKT